MRAEPIAVLLPARRNLLGMRKKHPAEALGYNALERSRGKILPLVRKSAETVTEPIRANL